MCPDIFKSQSAARPSQYIYLTKGDTVGHSDEPGVMIEWFTTFHEGRLATSKAVCNGAECGEYIHSDSDTRSLTCSDNPSLFLVKESPKVSKLFSIEIGGANLAWTLTSWDENSHIKIQSKDVSIQQFEQVPEE
ncbi:hypothetical protein BDR04DRAFT_1104523 [Suillus decipiens]|nr:hypothetical protein BDR04DRAFT_1104523 [Suillus decipiens]